MENALILIIVEGKLPTLSVVFYNDCCLVSAIAQVFTRAFHLSNFCLSRFSLASEFFPQSARQAKVTIRFSSLADALMIQ